MKNDTPRTELTFMKSLPVDQLSISDGLKLIIKEQKNAANEVKKSISSIEDGIKKIVKHLKAYNKGRIIYIGAGTSGRIGIQDGVELFPTFNWPKERVDFIIAGGLNAILRAVENAEDDVVSAKKIIIEKKVNHMDVVIGLAASGNTPFTCQAMAEAKNKNALTISISNNPKGKILEFGDIKVILDTKEEIIAGSTRLKAGTSQKICLNLISTMVMVKMGKVKNGYMKDMVPTNEKLRRRRNFIDNILNK